LFRSLALLQAGDPADAEAASLFDPVDREQRRTLRVTGPQEVAVQRVHGEIRVDGAGGGVERLAGHLPAEGAFELGGHHRTAIDVAVDAFELEHRADVGHLVHQPRSASRCGAGMSATLVPTMASPRPRETFASTAGSL